MQFKTFFLLVVLSIGVNGQGTSIRDYFELATEGLPPEYQSIGTLLTSSCGCLIDAIEEGKCNGICGEESCSDIFAKFGECANTNATACTSCGGLVGTAGALACGEDSPFSSGQAICEIQEASVNYVMDAFTLHADIREACHSIDQAIEDDDCQNTCSADTCSGYLGELQVCAKKHANIECYFAINSLRYHVAEGFLDCSSFDSVEGACRVQHAVNSSSGLIDNFNVLMPPEFGFVLGQSTIDSCTCLQNLTECDACDASNSCDLVGTFHDCAVADGSDCSAECVQFLDSVTAFLDETDCYQVGADETNCTDLNVPVVQCDIPLNREDCEARGQYIGDDVPIFDTLPSLTPSGSPTISQSSSTTPSATPTISVSSSETPTISVSSTNTPSNSVSSTNTPSNSVSSTNTPSNSPTSSQTPSNTPSSSVSPEPDSASILSVCFVFVMVVAMML